MESPQVNLKNLCENLDYSYSTVVDSSNMINCLTSQTSIQNTSSVAQQKVEEVLKQLKIDYPKKSMRTLKASKYVATIFTLGFYLSGLLCLTKLTGQGLRSLQKHPAFLEPVTRSSWKIPLSLFLTSCAGTWIATLVNRNAAIPDLCAQLEKVLQQQ